MSMLPPIVLDHLNKEAGIIVLNGNRYSGLKKLIHQVMDHVSNQNKKGFLLSSASPKSLPKNWIGEKNFDPGVKIKVYDYNPHILLFENVTHWDQLEMALEFSEEGRLVIMHLTNSSLIGSLHKLASLINTSASKSYWWRIMDLLLLSLSQLEVLADDGATVSVHEIVPISPEMKRTIYREGIDSFEEGLKITDPDTGVLTFNQSLLQLLIRRKISLAKAFEVSRDPSDLDALLKKVGI